MSAVDPVRALAPAGTVIPLAGLQSNALSSGSDGEDSSALHAPLAELDGGGSSWADALLAALDARWQTLLRAPRRRRHAILRRWLIVVVSAALALVALRAIAKSALKARRATPSRYALPSYAYSHNNEMQGEHALDIALDLGFGAVEVDVWLAPVAGPAGLARRAPEAGPAPSPLAGPHRLDAAGAAADALDPAWTLYVGHTARDATRAGRTLKDAYLDPLLRRLDALNAGTGGADTAPGATGYTPGNGTRPVGLYPGDPAAELMLVIDIKTDGERAWPYLLSLLAPLESRGYLTTYDAASSMFTRGALLVVGTGNTPLARVHRHSPRRVFYDAPLRDLARPALLDPSRAPGDPAGPAPPLAVAYTRALAPLASAKLPLWAHLAALLPSALPRPFNPALELLAAYSAEARRAGAEPRWWSLPPDPWLPFGLRLGLRQRTWSMLRRAGVKWVTGDDLVSTRAWVAKSDRKAILRDAREREEAYARAAPGRP